MSECPFCRSEVHEEAVICPKCNAEKVSGWLGNFEKSVAETQAASKMLGFFGLLIGVVFGFGVGMSYGTPLGVFVGFISFFVVTFAAAILRTLLFKRGKTIWYR